MYPAVKFEYRRYLNEVEDIVLSLMKHTDNCEDAEATTQAMEALRNAVTVSGVSATE